MEGDGMEQAVAEVVRLVAGGSPLGAAVYAVGLERDMTVREAGRLLAVARMTLADVGPLPAPARVPDAAAIMRDATVRTRPTVRPGVRS